MWLKTKTEKNSLATFNTITNTKHEPSSRFKGRGLNESHADTVAVCWTTRWSVCVRAPARSDMQMTDGEQREQPISWTNLESIGEVGKPERANTPLQGERGLNIFPARAAEIQLQPNEEWADLPSPSPPLLLPLSPCISPSSRRTAEAHYGH